MLVHLYSIVINFLMFSNKYGLANMDTRIPQLRIQVLDAGPDTGLWTLGSWCWTLDSGRWPLNTELWTLDSGCWTLDVGLWTLDSGCWSTDAGLWTLGYGLWTLGTTLWTLGSEHWTLSFDCFRTESEPSFWFCLIKLLKILSCESLRTS